MKRRAVHGCALVALTLVVVGCATPAVSPSVAASPSVTPSPSTVASTPASAEPVPGDIEAAPGSDSTVYAPNPGAIVVAIDAGHGGCLDWGVPDPSERGEQLAEKTLTLAIARALEALLSAQGIGVVMIRDDDEALAGDSYPPLGCEGPSWRDMNGDGLAGFGPDLPEATRTRDELQARLDLANLARADALVSIHINSPTEGGERIEIAFSETFYTDETPWGATATATLAEAMQAGVVERLDPIADYERGDRGITAHNFYLVAPPLLEVTPERPDPLAQPTRGGLMPVVLAEVGSITLRSEHDLLASSEGQEAVAEGLLLGLTEYLGGRQLAARISLADGPITTTPAPVEGEGPLFWAPAAPEGMISLRLTNTGTLVWPSDAELVAGWAASDEPYLAVAPTELVALATPIPPLSPGESVVVSVELPSPPAGSRSLAWISLMADGTTTADQGSPAIQLASEP
ncbi:MAG: N-acetylmuramoyl-L-alanine amidase [Chloroflexota bacterium]|nr:N-acetylmuramoyl-L-alanine amidase [Chloroflexota bacterium]